MNDFTEQQTTLSTNSTATKDEGNTHQCKEHGEQVEKEEKEDQRKQKEQNEQKEQKTQKRKVIEKPSTYNAKGQRYAFLLLGILCLALVLSLFIGEKPEISSKSMQNVSPTYQDNTPTFNDQLQREGQRGSNKSKNMWIDQMRHQDSTAPQDWQRQETVRVLNSRKAKFHLVFSKQAEQKETRDTQTNIQGSNSQDETHSTSTQPSFIGEKSNLAMTTKRTKETIKEATTETEGKNKNLIPTGTVISAVLDQDINSDYAGQWLGHVTHDVYSVDQEFILIPKGTKVIGKTLHIGNVNAPIQNRMGLTVEWAILPDGSRIDFRKADVEDQTGIHAIKDRVNRHLGWQLGGVAAYAMLSSSSSNTPQPNYYGQGESMTFMEQFQLGLEQQTKPMISKYLSLVPTVIIRAGTPIKILVKDDLSVSVWSRVNQTIYR